MHVSSLGVNQHRAIEINGARLIYRVKAPTIHLENKPYSMFSYLSLAEEEQIFFLCIFYLHKNVILSIPHLCLETSLGGFCSKPLD